MKRLGFLVFLLLNNAFLEPGCAHGVKIKYQQTSAIAIQASFDDGTPMKNAQAVVYSPQDPTSPWLTVVTDEKGQFTFVPDSSLSGNWDVKIRQSGHGKIVSIPVVEGQIVASLAEGLPTSETRVVSEGNQDFSPWQKLLMTMTSVWGFIGTACFFSRNQNLTKNN
ncbi:MAG: carboxypeptidase regulatory-like domain-containing protein [Cyanobacteria bacterium P01_F01_bin.143]